MQYEIEYRVRVRAEYSGNGPAHREIAETEVDMYRCGELSLADLFTFTQLGDPPEVEIVSFTEKKDAS